MKNDEGVDFVKKVVSEELDVEEEQRLAKELEGDWRVVRKQGTLIRESAELDSDEVGIVAYREVLTVDKAEPNYNGSFKTRMRIVKKVVKMKNGEEEEVQPSGLSAVKEEDEGEDVELPPELVNTPIEGDDCDACTI